VLIATAVAVALGVHPYTVRAQNTLSVATWGGAYGRAQEIALFEPFAKKTGTVVATEIYDGKLPKLRSLIDSGTPVDVVDVSAGALSTLCKDGLLETIDAAALETEGDSSSGDDFFTGAVSDCGVASVAWSTAVAFDRDAFSKGQPENISALLDTARFPGKRGLPKNPHRTIELALLADGVPPETVYSELATAEGADRAFAALDKIKNDVFLWDKAEQPITWLLEDKVAMTAGYSGRIFRAAVGDRNVDVLWDGQIYDVDAWAIPKTSENKEEAMRFIRFATAPEQLAAQARLTAYGPMRKSALGLVGTHPIIGVDMQKFLPTAPANFQKALKFDDAWWDQNGAALTQRFAIWAAEVEAAEAARQAERKAKEAAETENTPKAAP
jgi:putative spermidine/putrescine transport system substrate-binding protein